MKFTRRILFIFLCLANILNSEENQFKITFETICVKEILASIKYSSLENFNPGHNKTVIRLENFQDEQEFILTIDRSFCEEPTTMHCSLQNLIMTGISIFEYAPVFFISDMGYFPGEIIDVTFESKDGKLKDTIRFVPQPLIVEDAKSHAKIRAELYSLKPTQYRIYFDGFIEEEKIQFISCAAGNTLRNELVNKNGKMVLMYTPDTGAKGGNCNVSFIRENGDRLHLDMPWGEELRHHLQGERKPVVSKFQTIKSS